uniref:Uncharacterized protein n=1 Tax=Romanomermis culicivorax TaxID=13658 RepID=A0A915HK04_ROMCU
MPWAELTTPKLTSAAEIGAEDAYGHIDISQFEYVKHWGVTKSSSLNRCKKVRTQAIKSISFKEQVAGLVEGPERPEQGWPAVGLPPVVVRRRPSTIDARCGLVVERTNRRDDRRRGSARALLKHTQTTYNHSENVFRNITSVQKRPDDEAKCLLHTGDHALY